jgi:hypothetical protein
MNEVSARAVLVPTSEVSDGVTMSIPRSELDEVVDANATPIELVLDVVRASDGETSDTRTVSVSWERDQLERLLREAQGDEVILTFDREALRRAIEDDVEAHGFREVAIALAIAGTAAGGVAATASAEPGPLLGTAAPTSQSVGPDDRAFARTPPPTLSPDDRALPRLTPTAEPTLSPDDRALPRMTPTAEPTLSPDDRAFPRGTPIPATGTVSDPGISWSPSPAQTGVLAGVIALAIAGGYFIVAGRRRPGIRPT